MVATTVLATSLWMNSYTASTQHLRPSMAALQDTLSLHFIVPLWLDCARQRSALPDTGGKGTWKQVGTCQEHCKDWNTLFDMFPGGTFCTHPECHTTMHLQYSHQENLIYICNVISTCS